MYIKREDAKQHFCNDCRKTTYEKCEYKNTCASIRVLNRAPSADVVERKRGEWIDTGSGQECSVCGEIQYGYDSMRKFCANCGADNRPKLAGKHADQIIIDEAVADMRGSDNE